MTGIIERARERLMDGHSCQFAALIGQKEAWQTDDDGLTVCRWCHEPKEYVAKPKAATTNNRKVVK